ncbi:MAG: cupin domain-containing protein [Planctomycetes bacterium]|nr:cupin domain-containing protein [Planctomycetota bacterium]MCW8134885.1 cupin domain-containing protein [Planctomycetota bacterium]
MHDAIQIRVEEREWREFSDAPGVSYKTLRKHDNGGLTLLLRFAPGARYHTHKHPGGEEYYVLDGELNDLGKAWPAGSYIWHPPGSVHRPASTSGCVVLVILPQAVELMG